MSKHERDFRRIRAFDAAFAAITFVALANFLHYAIQGDHGLFALIELQHDRKALSQQVSTLRVEREDLETLTRGLQGPTLDLDLLDERARAVLGLMRTDEVRLTDGMPTTLAR
jgi:cell division protein FtsB